MTSRERMIAALCRRIPDRLPMAELCFWPDTIARWKKEGLPEHGDVHAFLGLDRISSHTPFDGTLRLPVRTLEETEEWKVEVNANGVSVKSWKQSYAPPSEIDFTVRTRQDWDGMKNRLVADEGRLNVSAPEEYEKRKTEDVFRTINPVEPLWYALTLLGFEGCLSAMAGEADFVEDIVAVYTEFVLGMMEICRRKGFVYDALWFSSDLCYKNGMLFSDRLYRQRFRKYHRRITEYCGEQGMLTVFHCDGDVRNFIPLLIESGFDCVQPLEARAGNDVRRLKAEYGKDISFMGNINMDVLARGRKIEIEEEVLGKISVAARAGGYVFHSDHSVPPTVSFDSYRAACEAARGETGWRD